MLLGDWIGIGILGGISLIGAVYDVRTRKIPILLMVAGGILILGITLPMLLAGSGAEGLAASAVCPAQRLFGLIPGAVMMLAGARHHMIGTGDSILILLYGWGLGFRLLCFFLLASFLCLLPAALISLFVLHRTRKDTLPYYPFAALGCAVLVLCLAF